MMDGVIMNRLILVMVVVILSQPVEKRIDNWRILAKAFPHVRYLSRILFSSAILSVILIIASSWSWKIEYC